MPLTSTDKAMPRPGESRKIGPRSTSTSRDSSQQRAPTSVPNPVHHQRNNHDDGLSSRRLSVDKANVNANALRVDLPDTLAPSRFKSSRPGKESSSRQEKEGKQQQHQQARRVKAEPGFSQPVLRLPVANQVVTAEEDDTATTSLTFNDTGWESDQDVDGQRTAVFRGDWTERLAGGAAGDSGGGNGVAPSLDGFSDGEDAYGDDSLLSLSRETPSRMGAAAVVSPKKTPVTVPTKPPTRRRVDFYLDKDSSPIDEEFEKMQRDAQARPQQAAANVQSSLARHAEHRQEVRYSTPAPASSLVQPSKVAASSDEGPADGDHQPQNAFPSSAGTKRAHEEIDYDVDELVGKSYSELDAVPFLTDPRAPTTQDSSGSSAQTTAARSLDAQLDNLSQLPTADQIQLFQSLSESDNEQAGAWFAAWFGDSVKQVQQQRLQRRKIALKYEMEARKRQRAVEAKMAECETQLAEMKQGGSKLVEGRSAAKLGMTPRREAKFR